MLTSTRLTVFDLVSMTNRVFCFFKLFFGGGGGGAALTGKGLLVPGFYGALVKGSCEPPNIPLKSGKHF